jgi:hypothetical protein
MMKAVQLGGQRRLVGSLEDLLVLAWQYSEVVV